MTFYNMFKNMSLVRRLPAFGWAETRHVSSIHHANISVHI